MNDIYVQIDTREKTHAIEYIIDYFKENGIAYVSHSLVFGDYQNLYNPLIIVDRKQNLVEIQSNITAGHERFRREMLKAVNEKFKLIFLIAESNNIKCLEDIISNYKNPRYYQWLKNGKKQGRKPPLSNETLYAILNTMKQKYGVEFVFCTKEELPKKLVELLKKENLYD